MKNVIKAISATALILLLVLAFPMGAFNFVAAEATLNNVVIHDNGRTIEFLSSADTVADALVEAGVIPVGTDRISHSFAAPVWDGIVITIECNEGDTQFTVQIDGQFVQSRVSRAGVTVEDMLWTVQREQDIALVYGGDDVTRLIVDGDELNFLSWVIDFETEIVTIAYEIVENETPRVWEGRSHLRQEGEEGEYELTMAVVLIGGEESNREVVSSRVLVEPVDTIIDIGTARMGALTDVTEPDFHYARRVRMEATAYTAGFSCTGKHPCDPWFGITASGRRVEHGIVAVDRTVIPLGTRLYVEGYGFALAADVGGAIRGYKIDLFMYEMADALRFGRRHIYVWILD